MKPIFTLAILLLFTSCVSSKITSNKAPDFNEKIDKLYIMVKGTDSAKSFYISFIGRFRSYLNTKDIESKTHYMEPLSLESESEINEKVVAYSPNLIMVINQTESRQTVNHTAFGWGQSGTHTGGTFDVRIYKPHSKKPVWRGNLKADGQLGLESSAKKATEKLIEKLVEDGLL